MGNSANGTQGQQGDFQPRVRERTDESAGGDFQPRARERTDESQGDEDKDTKDHGEAGTDGAKIPHGG